MKRRSLFLAAIAVALFASILPAIRAQSVVAINPTSISFTPSPLHDATLPVSGGAVLTSYAVAIMDGANEVRLTDIGKPTPAGGTITVPLPRTGLANNKTFTAVIVSNGPGGSERSTPSNPFAWEALSLPGAASNVVVR